MNFYDLQINGYAGADFNSDSLTEESLHLACLALKNDGVEHILATVITDSIDSSVAVGIEVGVPASLGRRWREFDFIRNGALSIIEGRTVGGRETVNVSDFEVVVVKTPSSERPISLSISLIWSVPVHDNVVDLLLTGSK